MRSPCSALCTVGDGASLRITRLRQLGIIALLNREMSLRRYTWHFITHSVKVFRRTIFMRICGQKLPYIMCVNWAEMERLSQEL